MRLSFFMMPPGGESKRSSCSDFGFGSIFAVIFFALNVSITSHRSDFTLQGLCQLWLQVSV